MGRPSEYSQELGAKICAELADGKSLRKICEADDLPSRETVRLWLLDAEENGQDSRYYGFFGQYVRAREEQADHYADEIIEIADQYDKASDTLQPDLVNRAKLRIDARKWVASKLKPKRYGDKVDVNNTGELGLNVTIMRYGAESSKNNE